MNNLDHERAWEATATHAQLKAKHQGKFPIIRRRFRVEGTQVGNSRLLTWEKAMDTRGRYGGSIAEVIEFKPLAERQALNLKACPHCEVAAGKPCKSNHGKVVPPHAKRWELEQA